MKVAVKKLVKYFDSPEGRVTALKDVEFQIPEGKFYTLLGPSGCGKSTTLRCIAGLETPDSGEISISGQIVAGGSRVVPANLRPIGMVFQSYAIWPHMTVFNNVAFPLKQRQSSVPKSERMSRVMEALKLVKMDDYAHRLAPFLSGGQQQRVALARALVSRPEVLLLDEPLSNLDAKLREELRIEIKDLTTRLGITTLYVTHDQLEALTMSDTIAVMHEGSILQEGSPRDIYVRPNARFVAQFVGQVNLIEGDVVAISDSGISGTLSSSAGLLRFTGVAHGRLNTGDKATIAVRPENLQFATEFGQQTGGRNLIEGQVVQATFVGDALDCLVSCGRDLMRAKANALSDISVGQRVALSFDPAACTAFRVS